MSGCDAVTRTPSGRVWRCRREAGHDTTSIKAFGGEERKDVPAHWFVPDPRGGS